jgi:hypothetical protein
MRRVLLRATLVLGLGAFAIFTTDSANAAGEPAVASCMCVEGDCWEMGPMICGEGNWACGVAACADGSNRVCCVVVD